MNKAVSITLLLLSLGIMGGCASDSFEKAGKSVDEALTSTGEAIKDAGQATGEALTKACENVKEAVAAQDKNC
ncbi:hypothetical protein [Hahella ganghwensis]|uniref:hypothetical protein n=1 Tax=Hahella ganghwensis TaxID=286420 RepID=UPI0003605423|nr:hypothetical protein [Hahella ganghwensis]